jgi:hypothetical protein
VVALRPIAPAHPTGPEATRVPTSPPCLPSSSSQVRGPTTKASRTHATSCAPIWGSIGARSPRARRRSHSGFTGSTLAQAPGASDRGCQAPRPQGVMADPGSGADTRLMALRSVGVLAGGAGRGRVPRDAGDLRRAHRIVTGSARPFTTDAALTTTTCEEPSQPCPSRRGRQDEESSNGDSGRCRTASARMQPTARAVRGGQDPRRSYVRRVRAVDPDAGGAR